ncbi:hypothetical protein CLV48_10340 [Cecembia rubra]|uniref:Uncharacterized protein n=1 Tax=Cecembia rubra TaxID=1485585 RepID=A0A2P8E7U0_9BACT|nr:hypothetical protein CLV48_10340 [Cecembia rubra]
MIGYDSFSIIYLVNKKKLVRTCFLISGGGNFILKSEGIPETLLFGEGIPALHGVKGGIKFYKL